MEHCDSHGIARRGPLLHHRLNDATSAACVLGMRRTALVKRSCVLGGLCIDATAYNEGMKLEQSSLDVLVPRGGKRLCSIARRNYFALFCHLDQRSNALDLISDSFRRRAVAPRELLDCVLDELDKGGGSHLMGKTDVDLHVRHVPAEDHSLHQVPEEVTATSIHVEGRLIIDIWSATLKDDWRFHETVDEFVRRERGVAASNRPKRQHPCREPHGVCKVCHVDTCTDLLVLSIVTNMLPRLTNGDHRAR
mmetsp:Transcript_58655/g.130666  ORF Transcript_58655/g.130666 Transcript_58655/m.130666 type:complete len:250 (-) Transcript_58655:449-1198(-)